MLWVNIGQPDETNVTLNTLPPLGHGWNLQAGYAINNHGDIVGYGTSPAGETHGFVMVRTNPPPRAVQLVALEVVQVIQDWSNSVRLIQGKETYVRAHLQITNDPPVLVEGARLYGSGPSGPLPGSPLSPIPPGTLLVQTKNASSVRGQWANTLNFRLPATWLSNTLTLRFDGAHNR